MALMIDIALQFVMVKVMAIVQSPIPDARYLHKKSKQINGLSIRP